MCMPTCPAGWPAGVGRPWQGGPVAPLGLPPAALNITLCPFCSIFYLINADMSLVLAGSAPCKLLTLQSKVTAGRMDTIVNLKQSLSVAAAVGSLMHGQYGASWWKGGAWQSSRVQIVVRYTGTRCSRAAETTVPRSAPG